MKKPIYSTEKGEQTPSFIFFTTTDYFVVPAAAAAACKLLKIVAAVDVASLVFP